MEIVNSSYVDREEEVLCPTRSGVSEYVFLLSDLLT